MRTAITRIAALTIIALQAPVANSQQQLTPFRFTSFFLNQSKATIAQNGIDSGCEENDTCEFSNGSRWEPLLAFGQPRENSVRKRSNNSVTASEKAHSHMQNNGPETTNTYATRDYEPDEYLKRARELAKADMQSSARTIIELTTKSIMITETADAYNVRGTAKGYLGDREGEIQDYTQALKLDPGYFKAYHNRGNARRQSGDEPGAFEDIQQALELKPDYLPSLKSRAVLNHERGRSNEALSDIEQVLRLDSSDPEVYLIRAGMNADSQRYLEAIRDCRISISLAPSREALGICAYSNLHAQHYQEALNDFDILITLIDDRDAKNNAIIARSTAAIAIGDNHAAIRDLSKLILNENPSPLAFAVRGQAFMGIDKQEKACQDWNKAKEQGEESVVILLKQYC